MNNNINNNLQCLLPLLQGNSLKRYKTTNKEKVLNKEQLYKRHTKPLPPPPSNSPYAIEQPNFAPPPYEQFNLYSEQENTPVWLQQQLKEEGAFDVNGIQLVERDSVYWNTKEIEQRFFFLLFLFILLFC